VSAVPEFGVPAGDGLPQRAVEALREILGRQDPGVVGVLLSGSAARGLATSRSDVDVYVVDDGAGPSVVDRRPGVDEVRLTLAELEQPAPFGSDGWWYRWSFAWALVLRDDAGGRVAAAVKRQATLTAQEQDDILAARLDGYINFVYRALKADRDGRDRERRLDAAESTPWLLDIVFALEGRVRPYNKYLAWELHQHPLDNPDWSAQRLLPLLDAALSGDPVALRELYRGVEHRCLLRDADRGTNALATTIEGWGPDLTLLRGDDTNGRGS